LVGFACGCGLSGEIAAETYERAVAGLACRVYDTEQGPRRFTDSRPTPVGDRLCLTSRSEVTVIKIDRNELLRLVESEGAQVVDVLLGYEYDESHIPGAISIPLKKFTPEAVSGLSKSDPVVVYCHDGL
jgi:hypothetical protein